MVEATPGPLVAEYQAAARSVIERLAAIAELPMRGPALFAALAAMGPVQAVWTLEVLIRGVLFKSRPCLEVYAGVLDPREVDRQLDADRRAALVAAGQDDGCVAAVQWLLAGAAPPGRDGPDPGQLVAHELGELTLGHRRSGARHARRDQLQRFALDPDPGVIANLLQNPRATEAVVLSICARRPTVSAPLEAVFRAPRWRQRHRIRAALVHNPYLAQPFAQNLLPLLGRGELVAVRDDESLAPSLRLAAQRLLDLVPLVRG